MSHQKTVSSEQISILVEFMERHGDIANTLNTPQGRVRRIELWQELKLLLGQIGHGPDKTVEQGIKEPPVPEVQPANIQQENVPFLVEITEDYQQPNLVGGGLPEPTSEVYAAPDISMSAPGPSRDYQQLNLVGGGLPEPTSEVYAAPDISMSAPGPSRETQRSRRQHVRSQRRTSSTETPFQRATAEFAAIELRRLKFEEERERKQHELDLKRLELETLREVNLHERETARAQIDRDAIKVQEGFLNLLSELKPALLNFVGNKAKF